MAHPLGGRSLPVRTPGAAAKPANPTRLPPKDALQALLHTRLTVELVDGRIIEGNLLAVDAAASLLLSGVRATTVLPDTEVGRNVAKYYPFSHEDNDADKQEGSRVRTRELASVLVRPEHIVKVLISDDDAASFGRFTGVEFVDDRAVPPPETAPAPTSKSEPEKAPPSSSATTSTASISEPASAVA